MDEIIYHYASNKKGLYILRDKQLWMSDIRKSNDYKEMLMFYPDILDEITRQYREHPFDIEREGKIGEAAIDNITENVKQVIDGVFASGVLSAFVTCFSYRCDMLGQWRGYADDGKGICIGFSKDMLLEHRHDRYTLEDIHYINNDDCHEMVKKKAEQILTDMRTFTGTEDDKFMQFGYSVIGCVMESLKYKKFGFREEGECRMISEIYKDSDRYKSDAEFNMTDNDIVPHIPISFDGFEREFVKEIWLGPKNRISEDDLAVFLKQLGYGDTADIIHKSETSYR